jgi:hypothetical protein
MAPSDRKLILLTGGAVVMAAVFFALVLVFATGSSEPSGSKEGPLYIGPKRDLITTLDEGSPLYFANPFGGRGFWLDRQNGELIALDVGRPDDVDCSVKWKGRVDSYVACDGDRLTKDDLSRYEVTVVETGNRKGSVLVDLESRVPPAGSTSSE